MVQQEIILWKKQCLAPVQRGCHFDKDSYLILFVSQGPPFFLNNSKSIVYAMPSCSQSPKSHTGNFLQNLFSSLHEGTNTSSDVMLSSYKVIVFRFSCRMQFRLLVVCVV